MKEICAVIRINKINETKRALVDAGISSMTALKALGRGKGEVDYLIQPSGGNVMADASSAGEQGPKLFPKRVLTIVVPDNMAQETVNTIMRVNQTGQPGDGRIFVMPVSDAFRVRTEERGDDAINEQA